MRTADASCTENDSASCPTAASWLIRLAYEGTAYAGWQIQPTVATVQGVLESRLSRLFCQPVGVRGCSRTDSGVHALCQLVLVRPPPRPEIPAPNACRYLNTRLPADIRAVAVTPVARDFDLRASVVGKTYSYLLHAGPVCSPFLSRYCWPLRKAELNVPAMRRAAAVLAGTHDFSRFTVTGNAPERDPVKRLDDVRVDAAGRMLRVAVTGNAFLYRMVRRLVGHLVAVGSGRLDSEATEALLSGREALPFDTAPPQGLFLERVFLDAAEMARYEPLDLPFLDLLALPGHDRGDWSCSISGP